MAIIDLTRTFATVGCWMKFTSWKNLSRSTDPNA